MGACSARIFERGDAGRLIGIGAVGRACIDMRHAHHPSTTLRIEIGIQHTLAAAELELEARPLADLQRRAAEPADEVLRREADQLISLEARRFDGPLRRRRGLRPRGTGGDREGEAESGYTTHKVTMPADPRRGNVASA